MNKKTLLITSCSSRKLSTPAPAIELYQGTLFKKVIELVENNHFDLKILSAKYGLINPDKFLHPYNKVIRNKEDILKIRSEHLPKLKKIQDNYDRIIVIMGKKYRDVIKPLFNEKYIIISDNRGIGGYLSLLNEFLKLPKKELMRRLETFQTQ